MRRFSVLIFLLAAACGADGAPEPPQNGITGEARIGVVIGN